MKLVFVDAAHWIAVANPRDPWHRAATRAGNAVAAAQLVTTDEVLVEFLAALCTLGSRARKRAAITVRAILDDRSIRVEPQTRSSFLAGLDLYEQREDKGYSLTDCVSMVVMRKLDISDVLTGDRHFTQEGFRALWSDRDR